MTYYPYHPPQRPMCPPVYRPPVPPPPPRRSNNNAFWVIGSLGMIGLIVSLFVFVVVMMTPHAQRIQDTQSFQTGQSLGPEAVQWLRGPINGASAHFGCEIVITLHTPSAQPSWWDGAVVMQGCTDYVHQQGY